MGAVLRLVRPEYSHGNIVLCKLGNVVRRVTITSRRFTHACGEIGYLAVVLPTGEFGFVCEDRIDGEAK